MSNFSFGGYQAETEGREDYQPIPPGWYGILIQTVEEKATKSGLGKMAVLNIIVVDDGEHKDHKLIDNLNLWHEKATPSKIARQTLDEIIHATAPGRGGSIKINDSSNICNIPLTAYVDIELDKNDPNKRYNRIRKYVKWTEVSMRSQLSLSKEKPQQQPQQPQSAIQQAAQQPAQQQPATEGPPWQ